MQQNAEFNFYLQVIEAVKLYPALYNNKISIARRNECWQRLQDNTGIPAVRLKICWHYLCAAYAQTASFPLSQQMSFARAYISSSYNSKSKQQQQSFDDVNAPEFVIHEQDLLQDAESDKEFLFEELEVESAQYKPLQQVSTAGTDNNCQMQQAQLVLEEELPSMRAENDHEQQQQQSEEAVQISAQSSIAANTVNANETQKAAAKDATSAVPANAKTTTTAAAAGTTLLRCSRKRLNSLLMKRRPASALRKQARALRKVKKEPTPDAAANPGKQRCEDDIFGELVAATLKSMPLQHKNAVKRNIMNLLLS